MLHFTNANIVLPDRIAIGDCIVDEDRVVALGALTRMGNQTVDVAGGYLLPGFIDLHVHGGQGADFMDGTPEAFQTVLNAHLQHGTTGLTPTSTVASHEHIMRFLELTHQFRTQRRPGARVFGAHFYGPYFAPEAKGCHPGETLRPPTPTDYDAYLKMAGDIKTATVAPELPGAEKFAKACRGNGVRVNIGHSHATFEQVEQAIAWGARHVDHLYCAMSDRAKLRLSQAYPMRAGVLEATLYFDDLTTEIIADGCHLSPSLMKLAYRLKGADKLALVTDTMRAMDLPDGEYIFGHPDAGERVRRLGNVGVTLDGKALGSSVMGMDHMVRTFLAATQAPLCDVIKMASLTPARIIGIHDDYGSIECGKKADLLIADRDLNIKSVYLDGKLAWTKK